MFQLSPWKKLFICQFILRLTHDMILPFSNNCDKELVLLFENYGKCITAPSILMYLLNNKS